MGFWTWEQSFFMTIHFCVGVLSWNFSCLKLELSIDLKDLGDFENIGVCLQVFANIINEGADQKRRFMVFSGIFFDELRWAFDPF